MIEVWRVDLEQPAALPPTQEEAARAARFLMPDLGRHFLAAHAALRAILARHTSAPLEFAEAEKGKPYLVLAPEVRFNLSHSRHRGLVAVTRDVEVGVDIEILRPMRRYADMAERFFPPDEDQPVDEHDFFRRWTRLEALWKARGVGLYGAGAVSQGEWSVMEIDAGEGCVGAVAAQGREMAVTIHDFGANEA
jgi:4'-phosphopantetheinyl transferase